ncbi:MAG: hypothetical protein JNK58_07345 [Phycisphaerae bacterium]|nr:hypothetical protein [Phycisphaerae bacterium]
MNTSPQHNPARRRALTVLELLLATAITVIAGMALSAVLTTVARNITADTDSRSALTRAHAAYVRLRAYTEPALCLLQNDNQRGFALWLDDKKRSNTVNLREIRAVWTNNPDGTITVERVAFPDAWPKELQDDSDVALSSGADFLSEMLVQRKNGYTRSETLCDEVASAHLEHDTINPRDAAVFRFTLTMNDRSDHPPSVLTVHSFPNHLTPN